MLKTEQDTPDMEASILHAAVSHFTPGAYPRAAFEHGQWWVLVEGEDSEDDIYSVVDAIGPGSTEGFDFERVT